MAINFCFDSLGTNPDLGYPNLARPGLEPDQFDVTWPRCIPLRVLMYLRRAGIPFSTSLVQEAPPGSWYPVALAWHDHALDYFQLMSSATMQGLRHGKIRVLFYYHEGDNPYHIKALMDHKAREHGLCGDCYRFVSANSEAQHIDGFWYFADHEHFFRYINRRQKAEPVYPTERDHQFTALNRTHKWWRAAVMSDLWSRNVLTHSLWSYNTDCVIDDDPAMNPLRVYETAGWPETMQRFLQQGPYVCDQQSSQQHNDHRRVNMDLYYRSYCHIIMETHLDADSSGGAFLTEKTYKCLKYGQPFVLVGTPGSLQCLRQQGYRVFDHAIDNSYDAITDNTERWFAVRRVIENLAAQDLHAWFRTCESDLEHNQELFNNVCPRDLVELAHHLDTV